MTETIMQEILKTSTPLGVVIIVVWIFVNFLGKEGDKNRLLFQSLNDQNLLARKDTERALADNAQSTRENTAALRGVETAVLKFSK